MRKTTITCDKCGKVLEDEKDIVTVDFSTFIIFSQKKVAQRDFCNSCGLAFIDMMNDFCGSTE